MSYEISKLDQKVRAAAKQASRDEDCRQLAAEEISKEELKQRNGFFSALFDGDRAAKWKMVAIGDKPLRPKR